MTLNRNRRAIRHLLDERKSADAMAVYFAFYHPDNKTQIIPYPPQAERAEGYVTLSRTGMDLFRPLLTARLPRDERATAALLAQAVPEGTPVILNAPQEDMPLLQAFFQLQTAETLLTYELNPERFEPEINVLVMQSDGANGLPRFVIRQSGGEGIAAAAGLNWLSPYFGEISVNTAPRYRRRGWGRSVVAAMANYLLENGRIPLYAVTENNEPSMQLAENVGFTYRGVRQVMAQAVRISPPQP